MFKLFVVFFLLLCGRLAAQPFGNEWIDYGQRYYRVAVVSNGLYRIGAAQLAAAGVPLAEFDPRNIQLFHNGVEQYIHVEGEGDGIFHNSDFIEFYGEMNDGTLDTAFIINPSKQLNPRVSFYNDTAVYFITWNKSWANRRLESLKTPSVDGYSSVNYVFATVRNDFTSTYSNSQEGPYFNEAEGWVDAYFDNNKPSKKELNTPHFASVGLPSSASLCLVSANSLSHHLRVKGPGLSLDTIYNGFRVIKKSFAIDEPLLETSSYTAQSSLLPGVTTDKNAWAWIEINYPHTLDFENKNSFLFSLPGSHQDKTRLDITNFAGDSSTLVFDFSANKRIKPFVENGVYKVLFNNANTRHDCIVVNGSKAQSVAYVEPVGSMTSRSSYFTNFSALDASLIIITHSSLWNSSLNYYNYRRTTGYKPVIVDIDELYNQFGYGVGKHPVAIRNFCSFALRNSPTKPEYLFLIGKSLHPIHFRKNSLNYSRCLVPSGGNPASDQLITWRLGSSSYSPALACGRLVATSDADVLLYLNKVREYESNPPGEWMKNVLQFGGGKDAWEQGMIKAYLGEYQAIYQDTLMGANVQGIYKNTSEPIEITQADVVKQKVNSGVSILNFFGHAAATGFDQNIDLPSKYNNKGKYPMILASSCFSGDFNNPGERGLSENWVLTADKGAIGFVAGTESGYAGYLHSYSKELAANISYKNYNMPIGKSMRATIQSNEMSNPNSNYMMMTSLSINLHGDPVVKINAFEKPDLVAHSSYVSFYPEKITNSVDSFELRYVLTNTGRAFRDTFSVSVRRTFPNGQSSMKVLRRKASLYKDTLRFKLATGDHLSAGQNRLEIMLDAFDAIDEMNEMNNSVSVEFIVNSSHLIPVFPQKYAIFPHQNISFYASSPDPFTANDNAFFQIDTSASFSSPLLFSLQTKYLGGSLKIDYPHKLTNNTVYFWRVGLSNEDGNVQWNASSFTHIEGKTGWCQAHYHQFDEDELTSIERHDAQRVFSFIKSPKQLHCRNIGNANSSNWQNVEFTLDGSLLGWSSCMASPAINVAVFNPSDLSTWRSNKSNYGQRNYPSCYQIINDFMAFSANDANSRNKLANFLADSVPDGCYILAFSFVSPAIGSWEEKLFASFDKLGAKQLRTAGNDIPFIFFVQKGSPQSAREVIGNNAYSTIELYQNLSTNYVSGSIASTLIGPSRSWDSFDFSVGEKDSDKDVFSFALSSINPRGEGVRALDSVVVPTSLRAIVEARDYPFASLRMNTADNDSRTPTQLRSWKVFFDPYSEGSVDVTQFKFHADTVQEGDRVSLTLGFRNTSLSLMDSSMACFTVKNSKNEIILTYFFAHGALKPDELVIDSISFSTVNMSGDYQISVEYNSNVNNSGNYIVYESYRFNNIAQKFFHVMKDKHNPLLDVTFDGVHILNGDIVSSKPEIVVSLGDENKYFMVNDTSLFDVYLTDMASGIERKIPFSPDGSNGTLLLSPGTPGLNNATIIYKPVFVKDGVYSLRVNGKDASGNVSGDNDLTISFEVILKSTITNVVNYPNPFSSSTRFVFTLTGSDIPTDLRVQVFTISGKLVREISMGDLGRIHVGRNITPTPWDGTDMFGDKLANGVYLYRVFASINGKTIEHRSTELDKFIKKGFGKIYLMR